MMARLAKTVDGYKIFAPDHTPEMAGWMSNLGAELRGDHFFIWASDAGPHGRWVKETLAEAGYNIKSEQQF